MPSKTIVDFANQIKDYMRSAEVVEGKNLAYSQENNAVIATIENGKSYKVRWTGSATITLKKDSASGTEVTSGSTSPLSFTADSDFDLYFGSSSDVTEIMVYDGNDTSDTYEPYYRTIGDRVQDIEGKIPSTASNSNKMATASDIEQIYTDNSVLGAKNLLPTSFLMSTQTRNGITFDVASNGIVTITGTFSEGATSATANAGNPFYLPAGTYVLYDFIESSNPNCYVDLRTANLGGSSICNTNNADHKATFTITNESQAIYPHIQINSSFGAANVTVKPTILLPTDPVEEFTSYTMPNYFISQKIEGISLQRLTTILSKAGFTAQPASTSAMIHELPVGFYATQLDNGWEPSDFPKRNGTIYIYRAFVENYSSAIILSNSGTVHVYSKQQDVWKTVTLT